MRHIKILGLIAAISTVLVFTSGAQKTSTTQRQFPLPQQRPAPERQVPPAQAMERNKVPVRQLFEEMFTRGRYDLEDQVFDRSCRVNFGGRQVALQEAVAEGKGWRSAAPDLVMSVDNITASGDTVTVFWSARGTHTGQGHGLKPTGKRFSMRSRSTFILKNGKIIEARNEEYRPELFRQLGVTKTQALMFFATERLLAAAAPIIPDSFYAVLR
ncbi:MAG TPA: ester cyclase [Verrucomicrobiae bacterium]|nr:ester cyclase [Verrucomicrobiae bacterium]